MKINKGMLVFAAAAAMLANVASAQDSYLYWMVSDANMDGTDYNFEYAKVKVIEKDGNDYYLNIYDTATSADTGFSELYSDPDDPNSSDSFVPVFVGKFDKNNVNSFIVELFNDEDGQIGWQTYSWDAAKGYVFSGNNLSGGSGIDALVVSAVTPEPTSGVLMLLGGALLALRRKRRVA